MATKIRIYFDDWREFINIDERRNRNKTTKKLKDVTQGDVVELPRTYYNSNGETIIITAKYLLLQPIKVESIHSKLTPPKALCYLKGVDFTDITKGVSPYDEYKLYETMKEYPIEEGYIAIPISDKNMNIAEVADTLIMNILDHRVFSTLPIIEEEK